MIKFFHSKNVSTNSILYGLKHIVYIICIFLGILCLYTQQSEVVENNYGMVIMMTLFNENNYIFQTNNFMTICYRTVFKYENLIFLACIVYPLLEISQNPNVMSYVKLHNIPYIPQNYYFTYNCLYFSLGSIMLTIAKSHIDKLTNIASRWMLTTLSLNLVCVIIYWPLYFINPHLVKPIYTLRNDLKTPIFTELAMHLFPFLITLRLFIKDNYVFTVNLFSGILLCLCSIYIGIVFQLCKYLYGNYPYYLFEIFNLIYLICFICFFSMVALTVQLGLCKFKLKIKT
ncbi:hypothetical protein EBI_25415 [Enterocytozoon bieneusi H348]|nr:hypothetical protein EBI_25415 [Enterocytozoon bieneusi H348]|eukprot:XP_002649549.1 hypothetical protein EBI_25415 [Enterocytozoon bieneusi H348]